MQKQIQIQNQLETDEIGLFMRMWYIVTASPGHLVPWEGTMSIMVIQIMIEKRRIQIQIKKNQSKKE